MPLEAPLSPVAERVAHLNARYAAHSATSVLERALSDPGKKRALTDSDVDELLTRGARRDDDTFRVIASKALAGISGLGHMTLTAAFVLLFLALLTRVAATPETARA